MSEHRVRYKPRASCMWQKKGKQKVTGEGWRCSKSYGIATVVMKHGPGDWFRWMGIEGIILSKVSQREGQTQSGSILGRTFALHIANWIWFQASHIVL